MNSKKTLRIVFTGLFAALVCVAILIFHIPVGNGIVHLGDAFIYLGAIILPFPFGIFAGAIGGSLSDLLDGYAIYAFPTLIVKSLNALCFYIPMKSHSKIISIRTIIAAVVSSIITVVGYYFVAVILYGGFKTQLAVIPGNIIQAGGSLVVFLILGLALDKAGILKKVQL